MDHSFREDPRTLLRRLKEHKNAFPDNTEGPGTRAEWNSMFVDLLIRWVEAVKDDPPLGERLLKAAGLHLSSEVQEGLLRLRKAVDESCGFLREAAKNPVWPRIVFGPPSRAAKPGARRSRRTLPRVSVPNYEDQGGRLTFPGRPNCTIAQALDHISKGPPLARADVKSGVDDVVCHCASIYPLTTGVLAQLGFYSEVALATLNEVNNACPSQDERYYEAWRGIISTGSELQGLLVSGGRAELWRAANFVLSIYHHQACNPDKTFDCMSRTSRWLVVEPLWLIEEICDSPDLPKLQIREVVTYVEVLMTCLSAATREAAEVPGRRPPKTEKTHATVEDGEAEGETRDAMTLRQIWQGKAAGKRTWHGITYDTLKRDRYDATRRADFPNPVRCVGKGAGSGNLYRPEEIEAYLKQRADRRTV